MFVIFITSHAHEQIISDFVDFFSDNKEQFEFHIVADVIQMEDDPLTAIRQKTNSSLVVGIKCMKKRCIDAFVSIGNTGALIAGAALWLPHLMGYKRPALLATLPTEKGNVAIIDVGGNLLYKAHHFVQLAQLGVAYQRCCHGVQWPHVGLLNIGIESKKGTFEVRQAYQQLLEQEKNGQMKFVGNVEGRQVFQGVVDVLVTDGFTGNILLKTSEGVSSFILQKLKNVLQDLPEEGITFLQKIWHQFDYEEYSGAIVCGIEHVIVKCHGHSSPKGLHKGIQKAITLVQNNFVEKMRMQLTER